MSESMASKTHPKFAFRVGDDLDDPLMVTLRLTRNGYQEHVETIPKDAAAAVGRALIGADDAPPGEVADETESEGKR